jgi:uncharacterized membrane protein YdcZ (DUF606 family)
MLSVSFGEMFNMKKATLTKEIKNLMTANFIFSGFVITTIIFFADYQNNVSQAKELFSDWRLYAGILAEIIGVWLSRKNYEVNGGNMTAISFALFLSLVIVPIFSFLFTDLFCFKSSVSIKYQTVWEFIAFVLVSLILVVTFFIDKLNSKINNVGLLFSLPIVLSTSMFFTSKMMQVYPGVLYYGLIGFALLSFFFIAAIRSNELSNYNKSHIKDTLIVSGVSVVILPLNLIVIKLLAVEFLILVKRVAQILNAVILDKIHKNNNPLCLKDKIVIILICLLGYSLYYFRG